MIVNSNTQNHAALLLLRINKHSDKTCCDGKIWVHAESNSYCLTNTGTVTPQNCLEGLKYTGGLELQEVYSRQGLRFFFVPRSLHIDYSIFSYFFTELKIHHLSLFKKAIH